jgi:hypothetical protein
VADVELLQVPVKLRLELGAVVGLNDVDSEWQTTNDFVGETNRGRLRAAVVDFQDSNSSAVVDRGELVEALRPSIAFSQSAVPPVARVARRLARLRD